MKLVVCIAELVGNLALANGAHAAAQGEKLTAANKCGRCHSAKTAPKELTFSAIAEKYKGRADATARLVDLLKKRQTRRPPHGGCKRHRPEGDRRRRPVVEVTRKADAGGPGPGPAAAARPARSADRTSCAGTP